MAEGKWIPNLTAETPLADAARWALGLRMEVVRDYLMPAMTEPEKDIEHVHQLRVGTRRAHAALQIFAPCLPRKAQKRAKTGMRTIRQAAGAARDWDVFLEGLGEQASRLPERQQCGVDFLFGYALGQRAAAQQVLKEASPNPPFGFDRLMTSTVADVHAPDDPSLRTLVDLARPMLIDQLHQLQLAGQADLSDYEHLHRIRVLGKWLRYTMEIFVDCFAPAFKSEIYPRIEEMQEILGRANDCHVGSQRLQQICDQLRDYRPQEWKRFRPGVEGLLRNYQRRLPKERDQFLAWWAQWQETDAIAAFTDLLKTQRPVEPKVRGEAVEPPREPEAANGARLNVYPGDGDVDAGSRGGETKIGGERPGEPGPGVTGAVDGSSTPPVRLTGPKGAPGGLGGGKGVAGG